MPDATGPILPAWFVIPLAAVAMLFLAGYVNAINDPRAGVPRARRRIRTASNVLLMWVTALIAYALSIDTGRDPRTFMLVWLAIIGLVWMVVLLAGIDIIATMRLQARARHTLRQAMVSRARQEARAHLALTAANQTGDDRHDARDR